MDNNYFNKRLKQLRKEKGLTQAQVSTALGIKLNTYSHMEIEGKRVDMDMLEKLSKLFLVSVDSLLGVEKKQQQYWGDIDNTSLTMLLRDSGTPLTEKEPTLMKDLMSTEQDMILAYRMMSEEDKAKVKKYIEKTFKNGNKK